MPEDKPLPSAEEIGRLAFIAYKKCPENEQKYAGRHWGNLADYERQSWVNVAAEIIAALPADSNYLLFAGRVRTKQDVLQMLKEHYGYSPLDLLLKPR